MSARGFAQTISGSLSVTTASNPTALGGVGEIVVCQNIGTNAAYIVLGKTAATTVATSTNFPLQPGASVQLDATSLAYIDAITASSTTTVVFSVGAGVPNLDTATSADLVVPGSISVTQGTSPWVVDNSVNDTPITPATATATKGLLIGVQYNSTAAAFTNGQQGSIQCDASGRILHRNSPASTGTMASVASSASSVTVLAANAARIGAAVYNDSTQILYLLLVTGGTASSSVYTVQMAAASYYEVPAYYTGALIGIWASANGNARVTEFSV